MNTPEEYIAAMQPKLCINCKHIARNGSGDARLYKCFAPANIAENRLDLVTGETSKVLHFKTCYDARVDGVQRLENCGPTGRWFEEAPPKINLPEPKPAGKYAAADLLSQLNNM